MGIVLKKIGKAIRRALEESENTSVKKSAAEEQKKYYDDLAKMCRDIELSAADTRKLTMEIMRGSKATALKTFEEIVEQKAFVTVLEFEELAADGKLDYLMLWNAIEGRDLNAKPKESSEVARLKILNRALASFGALQQGKIDVYEAEGIALLRAGKEEESRNIARKADEVEALLKEKIALVGPLNVLKEPRDAANKAALKIRSPDLFKVWGR